MKAVRASVYAHVHRLAARVLHACDLWKAAGALALGGTLALIAQAPPISPSEIGVPVSVAVQSALVVLISTALSVTAGAAGTAELALDTSALPAVFDCEPGLSHHRQA